MSENLGTDVRDTHVVEQPTGLEDVIRSVRGLARTARDLGVSASDVLERELAMAITISQQVRDRTISEEMLKRVRNEGIPARLRKDAHDLVDLVADIGAVVAVGAIDLLEGFVDERRPPLPLRARTSTSASTNKP